MSFIKQLFGLIVYKIAPIKRNRFVFTSFGGHYSDNTKAISEKLHEMDSSAEIVWLISENYKSDLPEYVRAVDINSFSIYWYRGSAAAQIDNVYGFRAFFLTNDSFSSKLKSFVWRTLSYKKNQPIYVTMHGTPLKKIGRDQIGNVILGMSCPNTYMLVGDQLSADVFERVTFGTMPITVIGAPRNDALFLENSSAKKKLGLPIDKKILLFAPTFRNDGIDVEGKNIQRSGLDQLSAMDFEELFGTLNEKFGGEWVMVCRFHYHVADMVDWDSLNKKYPGRFINGNKYDDMADYLSATDILISDSSSCMFDFAHIKKPCFIYFPDLENYRDKERGFYMDIESLPFPVAVDFSKFIENIKTFDQAVYSHKVDEMLENIGTGNDGHASERAVEYIFKNTKKYSANK